jgi:hypothetical protein
MADQPTEVPSVWRVGTKVPLNVYEGDRPVCQCHSVEDAASIVEAMNRSPVKQDGVPSDEEIDAWVKVHEFQCGARGPYVINSDTAEEFVTQVRDRTQAAKDEEMHSVLVSTAAIADDKYEESQKRISELEAELKSARAKVLREVYKQLYFADDVASRHLEWLRHAAEEVENEVSSES